MLEMAWRSIVRMSILQEGLEIKRRREEKKLRRPSWLSQLMRDQLLRILGRATAKRGWWKSWEEGGTWASEKIRSLESEKVSFMEELRMS